MAKDCGVGWHYVEKVESELIGLGEILLPEDMYQKDTQRSLNSYVNYLFVYTSTIVSPSVVSRWFLHAFPVRGGLCKPNLVPYDKFRPANIIKAKEYLDILSKLDPRRIKYCDEKSLKGRSIYNKKPRRDIVTGVVPDILTAPDLRNTYSIIGMCGIDRACTPMRFRITCATVNAELFSMEIEALWL